MLGQADFPAEIKGRIIKSKKELSAQVKRETLPPFSDNAPARTGFFFKHDQRDVIFFQGISGGQT